jgi:hypothetical protein
MPLPIDREEGKRLFKKYRSQRDGIRNCPEMASVCLICESIDIAAKPDADTACCTAVTAALPFIATAVRSAARPLMDETPKTPAAAMRPADLQLRRLWLSATRQGDTSMKRAQMAVVLPSVTSEPWIMAGSLTVPKTTVP